LCQVVAVFVYFYHQAIVARLLCSGPDKLSNMGCTAPASIAIAVESI